jgi:competence protein ComEA
MLGLGLSLALLPSASPKLAAAERPAETKAPVAEKAAVDLNSSTVEGLAAVPGIGPVLAERIVKWREQNGPFRRVEDLLKVQGIGEKSLEKLRPHVKVSQKD